MYTIFTEPESYFYDDDGHVFAVLFGLELSRKTPLVRRVNNEVYARDRDLGFFLGITDPERVTRILTRFTGYLGTSGGTLTYWEDLPDPLAEHGVARREGQLLTLDQMRHIMDEVERPNVLSFIPPPPETSPSPP